MYIGYSFSFNFLKVDINFNTIDDHEVFVMFYYEV